MKKLITLLPVILISLGIRAQGAKFGVFVDPQITWLSAESRDVEGEGIAIGINGGLLIDNYFQKNYAIHTGISLGTQGGSLSYNDSISMEVYGERESFPPGTTVEYRLNYITVPLGLKLRTNEIGHFSYYARLGFTNQFNIKAKASTSDNALNKDVIKDEISIYNLSYHFGLGVEYSLTEDTSLTFGAVYHNGFLDVTKSKSSKIYSRIVSFRIGVIF
ncbi:MAG: PorT family protein [Bacteroidales bacterium]|nr:PorT family protein [Bacteroidales bacterium]